MQSLQYFPRLLAEFHSVNEVGLILYLFSHESLCKPAALKYGIRNPVTETESWNHGNGNGNGNRNGIRNQISMTEN